MSNYVEGEIGPFGWARLVLSETWAIARQPTQTQSTSASAATLNYRPLQGCDGTAGVRQTVTRVGAVSATTLGAVISQRVEPYESVSFSLAASLNRQRLAGGGTTEYTAGSGGASLRLTEALRLEASAALQRTTARAGDTSAATATPQLRIIDYERYSGDLVYTPMATLSVAGSVGWVSSAEGSGVIQGFRGTWSPFSGGAIQVSMDYAEDVDPYTGQRTRRFSLFPHWTINRHAALELSYAAVRGTGLAAANQTSMFVTLRLSI